MEGPEATLAPVMLGISLLAASMQQPIRCERVWLESDWQLVIGMIQEIWNKWEYVYYCVDMDVTPKDVHALKLVWNVGLDVDVPTVRISQL